MTAGTIITILVAGSCAFGSLRGGIGFRATNNFDEIINQDYEVLIGDDDTLVTAVAETALAPFTGLGIDLYISPLSNFDIRMSIAEARYLHDGGSQFVIFPGIGADLAYGLTIGRLQPYATFGLTFNSFRGYPSHHLRAGFGIGYVLNDRLKPYVECQMWNKDYYRQPTHLAHAYSVTSSTGLGKVHAGLKFSP